MPPALFLHAAPLLLPPLLPGESELARLLLGTPDPEILSLRTRRIPDGGGWRHRLVDARDGRWQIRPARTLRPLGLAQAITLLDTATRAGDRYDGCDLARCLWGRLPADAVRGAIRIHAPRLPGLARHYRRREAAYRREWGLT